MNRENFTKLASFLESLDDSKFNMRFYSFNPDRAETIRPENTECMTVGCALGWGPQAGISGQGYISWVTYREKNFTEDHDEFIWCFGIGWALYDNTPVGAAKRIRYMLKHGVPKNFAGPYHKWTRIYNES